MDTRTQTQSEILVIVRNDEPRPITLAGVTLDNDDGGLSSNVLLLHTQCLINKTRSTYMLFVLSDK